jgi:broad specificity phosphatase PhoE
MNKLIVVRSGRTAWQDQDRIQGIVSLPLTDQGKQDLDIIAQTLSLTDTTILHSSGNESSGKTARYLAKKCKLKMAINTGFKEFNFGSWQGLKVVEVKHRYARAWKMWRKAPTAICPPNGESLEATYQRVHIALNEVFSNNNDRTIIIVAAEMVAVLIQCIMTGHVLKDFWEIYETHPAIQQYELLRMANSLVQVDAFTEQQSRQPDTPNQIMADQAYATSLIQNQ